MPWHSQEALEFIDQRLHRPLVTYLFPLLPFLLLASACVDGLTRPRRPLFLRSGSGLILLSLCVSALFGALLAITGHGAVSALLTLGVLAFFTIASNAKFVMLGEPLVFSDLALIGAVFKHPQFYLSAVKLWQKIAVIVAGIALFGTIIYFFHPRWDGRIWGVAIAAFALIALQLYGHHLLRTGAVHPLKFEQDVEQLGLWPSLFLYWRAWRDLPDPAPWEIGDRTTPANAPRLIIAVQCESFADPAEIFAHLGPEAQLKLPALASAREQAAFHGKLLVSGFGAYTMRTEYGLLFGRSEAECGYRRFDPLLTAKGEPSYALPAKLKSCDTAWNCAFLHPHDMRFYGRNEIMPSASFDQLVGEEHFTPPAPHEGRYVTDAAMAEQLICRAKDGSDNPQFLYAVTIENHGPWQDDPLKHVGTDSAPTLVESYNQLVQRSDAMLATLQRHMAEITAEKSVPGLLIFFGDHRPSIPGATAPQAERHTPYVVLHYDAQGQLLTGANHEQDLTPAELHALIVDLTLGADGI